MASETQLARPLPEDNPLDLSRYIDHIGAPMDWIERFGVGHCIKFPILCPVCRTDQVFIRHGGGKQDAYLMSFLGRGSLGLLTADGSYFTDDPQDRGLGIAVPLQCAGGHRFLFNIDHKATDPTGAEPCGVTVILDELIYAIDAAPEASDYDDAAATPEGRADGR